jgi:phosphomannomutase
MKLYYGMLLFLLGQTLAWFQSNSGIITEDNATKAIIIAAAFAPITTLSFAIGTKWMYAEMDSLWSIRFITFGIGYLVFIPLTWYFLGEEMFTAKNGISFLLCVALLLIQAFMK